LHKKIEQDKVLQNISADLQKELPGLEDSQRKILKR